MPLKLFVHARGRSIYKSDRIQAELAAQGVHIAVSTNVSSESPPTLPIAPNLLCRQFSPSTPNQVWGADITLHSN